MNINININIKEDAIFYTLSIIVNIEEIEKSKSIWIDEYHRAIYRTKRFTLESNTRSSQGDGCTFAVILSLIKLGETIGSK